MHHTYRPAATLRGLPTTLHRPVVGEQPSLLQQGEEEREGVWPEGAGQEGLAGGGSGEQQVECGDLNDWSELRRNSIEGLRALTTWC